MQVEFKLLGIIGELDNHARSLLVAAGEKRMFESVDALRERYGKHTPYLCSSFLAHRFAQHLGERGDIPQRKEMLLKGETGRRRLAIPMFIGKVA